MRPTKTPSYRYHKARDCAVVTIHSKNHYLGCFDSPDSWEKYHRLIAEFLAAKKLPPPPAVEPDAPLTVSELIAQYWRHAKTYYVKNGRPTSEVASVKLVLRFVRRLYGSTAAEAFSPKKLKAVRQAMVEHEIARDVKQLDPATGEVEKIRKVYRHGMSRRCINKMISRIKRMYAWAVEEELIRVEVHAALLRVRGLKRGKSEAREAAKIRPVSQSDIDAVLPLVPEVVGVMIRFQHLCGGRPQDVVQLRGTEIDRNGPIWEYRPRRHKTEHHNDEAVPEQDRVLFIGPKGQTLIGPLLEGTPDDYLFSPQRSERDRNASRKQNRVSKMTPSQARRRPNPSRKRPPSAHYSVASYRRAVRRACLKAGIAIWFPNQLRHSRLTNIRKLFGLEASRVVGGHREIGVTQIYAEQDYDLARRVMAEVG
jgi:integrase